MACLPCPRRLIALPLLGAALFVDAPASGDDDPVRWTWSCAVSGYYDLSVLPNGDMRPTKGSSPDPLQIYVRSVGEKTREQCGWGWQQKYFLEFKGNKFALFASPNK